MWIAKHLKLSHAYSELETLTVDGRLSCKYLLTVWLKCRTMKRRKVARDLHDTTGQTLPVLKWLSRN